MALVSGEQLATRVYARLAGDQWLAQEWVGFELLQSRSEWTRRAPNG